MRYTPDHNGECLHCDERADAHVNGDCPLRTGDRVVLVTDTGRRVDALVTLASQNGRSLALTFDAMIGDWLGGLAAFHHDDGVWRSIDGLSLTIERAPDEVT